MMKALVCMLVAGGSTVLYQQSRAPAMHDASAVTYEHLATAIIEVRQVEDNLVKGILTHYHALAQEQLKTAAETGANRVGHLESAAEEVANVANEGDKRVQSIRQRLSKAGHTHQTDTLTKEDYMFIDSTEKKALFAMAQTIGKLGANANPADIQKTANELSTFFNRAIESQ